jgi:2-hydroxy-3-oxopropionate reductase
MTAVAFLGLGKMGRPMSARLADGGFEVHAWNRTPLTLDPVVNRTVHMSCQEAVDSADLVVTVLPNLADLQQVCNQTRLKPGTTLVVMGTVSPIELVDWAHTKEALHVVDAPVSGGPLGAHEGSLSIMVGGDPGDVRRVLPALEAMGSTVRVFGKLGSGQIAKACNQIVVAATLTALAEATALATHAGLSVADLFDVMAGGLAGSRALNAKRSLIEAHVFATEGSAAFQHKDLGFALEAARFHGVAVPLCALVDQLFGSMRWTGRGENDHSGILEIIESLSEQL